MKYNFDYKALSKDNILTLLHVYYNKEAIFKNLEKQRKQIIKGSFSQPTLDAIKRGVEWQNKNFMINFIEKICHKALTLLKENDIILLQRLGRQEKIPQDFNGYNSRTYFRKTNEAFNQFGYHVCKQGVNDNFLENSGDFFKGHRNAVKEKYLLRQKERKQNEEQ